MKSKIIIGSLTVTSSIIAVVYIAYICLTYNDMLTTVPLRMFIEIAVIGWIIFNAMVLLISHIIKKRK